MPASLATHRITTFPSLSPSKITKHPLLSGGISRWFWRFYTQRLTPAGRWMALISGMFVAYGGASLQLQGFVLAGYVSAIWFIAGLAMLFYRPRASLRIMMANRVCAGEKLPIDLDVQQRGRSRGADLVVLPHKLPLAIDSVPDEGVSLPDLAAERRIACDLRCDAIIAARIPCPAFASRRVFPSGFSARGAS